MLDLAFLGAAALVPMTLLPLFIATWPLDVAQSLPVSILDCKHRHDCAQRRCTVEVAGDRRLGSVGCDQCCHCAILVPLWDQPPRARTPSRFFTPMFSQRTAHTNSYFMRSQNTNPDIVVLQETDERWLAGVASLRENYDCVVEVPRGDNFGLLVFCRVPVEQVSTRVFR